MTSSHPTSPDQQSQLIKLTPLATRRETSSPVASAVCPGTLEGDPAVAMLFADNTVRVYDTKSLQLIGPVVDLYIKQPQTVICSVDERTVVTGGAQGRLIVSNVWTGRVSSVTEVHCAAVISIDSLERCIVSVDQNNKLVFCLLIDGTPMPVVGENLSFAPLAVKLVFINGVMNVLVAREASPHVKPYEVEEPSPSYTYSDQGHRYTVPERRLVVIAVDDSHTLLAAASDIVPCLKNMPCALTSFGYSEGCIITTGKGVYKKFKGNWSTEAEIVSRVDIGEQPDATTDGDSMNPVVCLQVCRIGDHEVVVTGGSNGEITLWK